MRIEDAKQCATQPTKLFPGGKSCKNRPSVWIFGDPYCNECARKLIDLHKKIINEDSKDSNTTRSNKLDGDL